MSRVASLVSTMAGKASTNMRFRRFVDELLANDQFRDMILHRLGTRQIHDTERIDSRVPDVSEDGGQDFEDLLWLLSSNYANRGIALLMLDEAAWLYDTIHAIENPVVAELGRAKGGRTFLLASAGARVLSLENGALEAWNARHYGKPEVSYDQALGNALTKTGMSNRVEVLVADAEEYLVPKDNFDMVFCDIALPLPRMQALFDRWWVGVKPGGRLVLRDGREPRTPTVRQLAESLRDRSDVTFEEPAPGVFTILVKRAGDGGRPEPAPPRPVG